MLAPALVVLGRQIEELHPEGHPTDGTVASQAHDKANPSSDHRPTPHTGPGTVRALDFGENTEDDVWEILEAIRISKDSRLKYAIHEARMFSSYATTSRAPWEWGPYTGPSPHGNHGHLSTLAAADNQTKEWRITMAPPADTGPNGEPNWSEVSSWAQASWTRAYEAGLLGADTHPKDELDKEELMVFLARAKVI